MDLRLERSVAPGSWKFKHFKSMAIGRFRVAGAAAGGITAGRWRRSRFGG